MVVINTLARRQYGDDPNDEVSSWWYYSETAFIIKWIVTGVVIFLLIGFFLGGYLHAQRRIKNGKRPLRYHRFLLSRAQRMQYFPEDFRGMVYHQTPYGHGPAQAVPMQNFGPAPPQYGEHDYVPPYTPPQGSSKIDPDQQYHPPSGPPPGHAGPSQPMPAVQRE